MLERMVQHACIGVLVDQLQYCMSSISEGDEAHDKAGLGVLNIQHSIDV